MAWAIDPNFDSTLYAVSARAPFSVGGGNRMISLMGSGVAYRDDISLKNLEISGEIFFDTGVPLSGYRGGSFIARRQPDGSFYYAQWALGNVTWAPPSVEVGLHYYNGATDTITNFGKAQPLLPILELVNNGELLNMHFRLHENSISVRVMDAADTFKISEFGTVDTSIASVGNPGIGSRVTGAQFGAPRRSNHFLNNFKVNEI